MPQDPQNKKQSRSQQRKHEADIRIDMVDQNRTQQVGIEFTDDTERNRMSKVAPHYMEPTFEQEANTDSRNKRSPQESPEPIIQKKDIGRIK